MATNTRAAAKRSGAVSLDERLLQLINSDRNWQLFRDELLRPLETCKVETAADNNAREFVFKRRGFPLPNADLPTDTYYADRVRPDTMTHGGFEHLRYIATATHQAAIIDNDQNAAIDPFRRALWKTSYAKSSFFSMTAPVGLEFPTTTTTIAHSITRDRTGDDDDDDDTTTDLQVCSFDNDKVLSPIERLWLSGISFPFTHGLTERLVSVTSERLYRWRVLRTTAGGSSNTNDTGRSDSDTWKQSFAPLQHYRWLVPNSVVSDWYFALDPNSIFILNWYQFYLTRVQHMREVHDGYAAALSEQAELTRKKRQLSEQFATETNRIRESARVREVVLGRQQPIERDKTRRFLVSLDKLYKDFTASLPRGTTR